MSHSWWLPSLKGNTLFEGKPDQIKEWSNLFQIRASGSMEGRIYYISMKSGPFKVEGTPDFEDWFTAKYYLATNWKAMYDDIFEREILGGSEQDSTDNSTED